MNLLSGIVGALQEAVGELRVHRMRVLLSLLGVLIAVFAITTVTGFGDLVRQVNIEVSDRFGGREASYSVQFSPAAGGGDEQLRERFEEAFGRAAQRYGIGYTSREIQSEMHVQLPGGVQRVELTGVDQAYGEMRRVRLAEGSWFGPEDGELLAPPLIVSDSVWRAIGSPELASRPTLEIVDPVPITGVVVGVLPPLPAVVTEGVAETHTAYLLADSLARMEGESVAGRESTASSYLLWLPPETAEALAKRIESDLESAMRDDATIQVQRTDYLGQSADDPFMAVQILVNVVSTVVLLIGVVGYINLSVVTVRQRIREIGIRRSFGATSGRVFFTVLLESVAGTTAAGVIGIGLALLVLQNPSVQEFITYGFLPSELVPFPVGAAMTGLIVSVAVGVVAGFIPALVATRVRVIDAIRSN
ncbi:MAG: ABC transporter permease [Pseudoclavibacter sp.]|nr:ABC transporter permease [Pseudoclavibacter sp.]